MIYSLDTPPPITINSYSHSVHHKMQEYRGEGGKKQNYDFDFKVRSYFAELRRQVSTINQYFIKSQGINGPKIGVFSNADISKAMLQNQYVFVLFIKVLPDTVADSYDNFDENNEEKIRSSWYNDKNILGQIRYDTH